MSTRKSWPSFIVVILACSLVVSSPMTSAAKETMVLQKLNNVISAIIKTAGRRGPVMACKMALPDELCELVVEPVMSALYDDAPYLKPKADDTVEQLNQKVEFAIQYLQQSDKLQKKMMAQFSLLKESQDKIVQEIGKLGHTQQEIQLSIQALILNQHHIKNSVDTLVESQEKEDRLIILEKQTELLVLADKFLSLHRRVKGNVKTLQTIDFYKPDEAREILLELQGLKQSFIEVRQDAFDIVEWYNDGQSLEYVLGASAKFKLIFNRAINQKEERLRNQQKAIDSYYRNQ